MVARLAELHTHPRVLVVEDDEQMRELVASALRQDGYDVEEAEDGGRLMARVAAHHVRPEAPIDLIICDIRMPVVSGLDALRAVREGRWMVPVILMTAFGDDDTRTEVERLGAVLFDKPFDLDDLRTAVVHLLSHATP